MVGIYKITNPSKKVYIGQSWDLEKRRKNYSNNPSKGQLLIYNSIKKYGWSAHSFDIVCELPNDITQSILDQYEILYWSMHIDCNFKLMNIREPGKGGKFSEESKKKLSFSKKGQQGMLGKKQSEETKKKISLARLKNNWMRGKKHSEETKKLISEKSKRPRPANKGRIPWNKGLTGTISEETRAKMSEAKKGRVPWNKGVKNLVN